MQKLTLLFGTEAYGNIPAPAFGYAAVNAGRAVTLLVIGVAIVFSCMPLYAEQASTAEGHGADDREVDDAERHLADYERKIDEALKNYLPTSKQVTELRQARDDYHRRVAPRLEEALAARERELKALAGEMRLTAPPLQAKQAEVFRLQRLCHPAVINSLGMKFAYIPAGEFEMGSSSEGGRFDDETRHHVKLTKPFMLGVYHVTRGQFAVFVDDSKYQTHAEKEGRAWAFNGAKFEMVNGASWKAPGFHQADEHPVVAISWNDARAFCVWLSRTEEGKHYRLPTEAEWEYACRAGTSTTYFWGNDPDGGKGFANCADVALKSKLPNWGAVFNWDDGFVFTSPIGTFKPNPWGLYDMIGDAFQWCDDRYGDYPSQEVTDPHGLGNGHAHVLRGGSWEINPRYCRSAARYHGDPDCCDADIGFRVLLEAE